MRDYMNNFGPEVIVIILFGILAMTLIIVDRDVNYLIQAQVQTATEETKENCHCNCHCNQ